MHNSMFYNGFNPYVMPQRVASKSLFGGINKINWGNLLNNTQKTLNVINQAIPVYYQVKPIYNNAKTMFRLIGTMNESDNKDIRNNSLNNNNLNNTNEKNISNKPIFFS